MGKIKQRQVQVAKEQAECEKAIKSTCEGVQQGRFPSIRKAAEAYGVHYSTVERLLKVAKSQRIGNSH